MEVAGALARAVAADKLRSLPWTDQARQLQARVALMRRLEPAEAWPDLSDAAPIAEIESGWRRTSPVRPDSAMSVGWTSSASSRRLIPWHLVGQLDAALPAHLDLPNGRIAVDYTQTVPVASAKAQAFYRVIATPTLAGGRVPLQLALLSPAGRPIAITADLAGSGGRVGQT